MAWYQTTFNKYRAKSTIYNNIAYASKLEASYARELDLRLKAKDIKSWRRQVPIELKVNGEKICKYYVDFEITHNDGLIELIETKGFETEVWRLKRKLLEATLLKRKKNIKYTVVKDSTHW